MPVLRRHVKPAELLGAMKSFPTVDGCNIMKFFSEVEAGEAISCFVRGPVKSDDHIGPEKKDGILRFPPSSPNIIYHFL